jgi:hypothetical protein
VQLLVVTCVCVVEARASHQQQQQQQQDSFNENSSKADNLRRGLDSAPAQGPVSARTHIDTVTTTYTQFYTSLTRMNTQDNSHSLPFQAKLTQSLPYPFLDSTFFRRLLNSTFYRSPLPESISFNYQFHYLFYLKNHPISLLTITHHPSTIAKTISNTCPIHLGIHFPH